MKRIIGLCGYARTGKDSAAKFLVEMGWKRVAFADALKSDLIPFIYEHFRWDAQALTDEQKIILRPIMVAYGKAKRAIDPDYWVNRLFDVIALYSNVDLVISDVRYMNEVKRIESAGGLVIGIERPGYGPANEEEAETTSKCLDYLIEEHLTISAANLGELRERIINFVNFAERHQLLPRRVI